MPLKQDDVFLSHFRNSPALQEAAKHLDVKLPGIICSKTGNILFINERAKYMSVKTNISNVLDMFSSAERNKIEFALSEKAGYVQELSQIGEYLLILPSANELRCVMWLNLNARNYQDLLSLLRDSIHVMELLGRVFSENNKSAEKPRSLVSERMTKLIQLIELTELPVKPYSEILCDLTSLTKMLCEYASLTVSDIGGSFLFDSPAAVLSRINPELYALLFCSCSSLVMCKSECSNMRVSIEYESGVSNQCKVRFFCNAFSEGAGMFLSFLEYACYKIGIECSLMSDKEMDLTEFTLVIKTETDLGNLLKSDKAPSDLYSISRYIKLLSGRIYTEI